MAETPNDLAKDTSLSDNLALATLNFQALDDENRTKIIKNGSTPVLLMGYQKDGFGTGVDYGFKVAKPGYDVTTAGNANLSFNSAYNTFKIVLTGTLTIPATSAGTTGSINVSHGLSATPAFVAYSQNPSLPTIYNQLPFGPPVVGGANDGKMQFYISAYSSSTLFSTSIDVMTLYGGSSVPITVKYYLLQETAS